MDRWPVEDLETFASAMLEAGIDSFIARRALERLGAGELTVAEAAE